MAHEVLHDCAISAYYHQRGDQREGMAHRDSLEHAPWFENERRQSDFAEVHSDPQLANKAHEDVSTLLVELLGVIGRRALRRAVIFAWLHSGTLGTAHGAVDVVQEAHLSLDMALCRAVVRSAVRARLEQ